MGVSENMRQKGLGSGRRLGQKPGLALISSLRASIGPGSNRGCLPDRTFWVRRTGG